MSRTGVTCIIDNSDIKFTQNLAGLLAAVDIQDPVSEIIREVCINHHIRFGCGSHYLLWMIQGLKQSVNRLEQQGVPKYCIVKLIREAIDSCINQSEQWTIPVDLNVQSKTESMFCPHSEKENFCESSQSVTKDLQQDCTDNNRDKIEIRNQHVVTPNTDDKQGSLKTSIKQSSETYKYNNENQEFQNENVTSKSEQLHSYKPSIKQKLKDIDDLLLSFQTKNISKPMTTSSCILQSSRHFNSAKPHDGVGVQSCEFSETESNYDYEKVDKNRAVCPNIQEISIHNNHQKVKIGSCQKTKWQKCVVASEIQNSLHPITSISSLCQGLCLDSSMMKYTLDVFNKQNLADDRYRLYLNRIHSIILIGPSPDYTRLVDGLVINCTLDNLVSLKKHHPVRALVINGNLALTFHHKGYKKSIKGVTILDSVPVQSQEEKWISQVLQLLLELQVNVIFIKGHITDRLGDSLQGRDIVVIENIPYTVLEIVSVTTNTIPLTYILEAFEGNICTGIYMKEYDDSYLNKFRPAQTRCIITFQQSLVQTLVICHPCQQGAELSEEKFWQGASMLHNALKDGKIFPGYGKVEQYCSKFLKTQVDKAYTELTDYNEISLFRPIVFDELASVFQNISDKIKTDDILFNNECVLDHLFNEAKQSFGSKCYCTKSDNFHDSETVPSEYIVKNSSCKCMINSQPKTRAFEFESYHDKKKSPYMACCCHDNVYDNVSCKLSSWRKAVDTISDIIRTDCVITTGVLDDNSTVSSSVFDLWTNKAVL